jgi:hypothetical protein
MTEETWINGIEATMAEAARSLRAVSEGIASILSVKQ